VAVVVVVAQVAAAQVASYKATSCP